MNLQIMIMMHMTIIYQNLWVKQQGHEKENLKWLSGKPPQSNRFTPNDGKMNLMAELALQGLEDVNLITARRCKLQSKVLVFTQK